MFYTFTTINTLPLQRKPCAVFLAHSVM